MLVSPTTKSNIRRAAQRRLHPRLPLRLLPYQHHRANQLSHLQNYQSMAKEHVRVLGPQ